MAVKYGYLEETDFTNIANAIREKNGETTVYKPSEMADAIKAISTGDADTSDATATSSDILTGKTAYSKGSKITGSIPVLTATTYSPSDSVQTISSGQYLSGSQTIEAVTADNIPSSLKETKTVTASLTSSTDVTPTTGKVLTSVTVNAPDTTGTATSSDMLDGVTAWVNGVQVTGNIASKGATTYNPSDTEQVIDAGVYLNEDQTIAAVTADNLPTSLKETKTITASLTTATTVTPTTGKVLTSVTVNAPDTTGTAGSIDILNGKTAWVNGTQVTGEIPTNSPISETITPGGSTTISAGYYETAGSVSASLATTEAQIDSSLKVEPDDIQYISTPYGSCTITGGKFYTSDILVKMNLSMIETKTTDGSLTDDVTVEASDGKLMSSVTVTKPDMSSADATADDIVSGKKAYGSDGTLITGTHEEAGGTDTTDATANASDIVSGMTAYISTGKVTGTLNVLNYFTGTSTPSSDLGEVGELYLQTES